MQIRVIATLLVVGLLAAAALLGWNPPAGAQGGGTITGEVKVTGTPPAPKVVKVNKDNQVCGDQKKIADVAVGPGNGLAEAVVAVTDVKGPKAAKKATLDQKGCEFRPEVLVMGPGEVDILNSDGILHNIHTFSTANSPINKAQPKFKKVMTEKIEKPEAVKVACDVHSWMHGWIYVTESPAAVTDEKGSFKLENVPPGKHKVEVWHPVLGKQSKDVEVKAGQEAKVSFELPAKK
ncbi:MAG TPA: carboxypeptidase regulatory-like domain-containing protein [Methylomirabilota bacterium]|jgi:plastocyanin|nr:carboxypeptidase regulatory-like domain-containing protein [Methylomirabilota bacterium]